MFVTLKKLRQSFTLLLIISTVVIFLILRSDKDTIPLYHHNMVNETAYNPLPAAYISYIIRNHNAAKVIQNSDIYGDVQENKVIIVVLMAKLSSTFSHFLARLSEVNGINEALVIFSHSHYDEAMNTMIKSIHFCRVLQIFYPFSIQTHPTSFPGQHPNDCPTNMSRKKALLTKCIGASSPDFRGRYRNPVQSEKKHLWWWTCNFIFEKMNLINKNQIDSGFVIFLDDDFYLMKDFIYMAFYMKNIAAQQPRCELISLGTTAAVNFDSMKESFLFAAELTTFNPKSHSVIAFDFKTWNTIISHYDLFCSYEDTSWMGSLYYVSVRRKNGSQFDVMSSVTPRAFKLSSYEYTDQKSLENAIAALEDFEKANAGLWFPTYIEPYINVELDDEDPVIDYPDSEGGWADPRDQSLCRIITESKIKKVLMEMSID